MSNPVGWFEIYVRDMPRAQTFYEAVFGRVLHALPDQAEGSPQMLVFDMNNQGYGAAGALVRMPGFEPGDAGSNPAPAITERRTSQSVPGCKREELT